MASVSVGFIVKEAVLCTLSWLILLIVAVPVAPAFLILAICKTCVNLIVRILHPGWAPLDGLDVGCAVSMDMYKDKVLPNVGTAVVCEGDINVINLREAVRKEVLQGRTEEDSHGVMRQVQFDRLKKIPIRFGGYFYWSDPLPNIDLEKAIYEKELDEHTSSVDFFSQWIHKPYQKGCPFWEVCVCKSPQGHPGKSFILFKMLHCFGDGFSVARFITKVGKSVGNTPDMVDTRNRTLLTIIIEKIVLLIVGPRLILHYIISMIAGSDPLSRKEKVCDAFATTMTFPLRTVKSVRRTLECKFDDIFIGLLGVSLRRFLLASGEKKMPAYIPAVKPIALPRNFEEPMQNRMSTSIFKIPLGSSDGNSQSFDIGKLIKELSEQSRSFYARVAMPMVLSYFVGMPAWVPAFMLQPPKGNPRVCTAFTSLVPITKTITITNCEVLEIIPLAGLQLRQTGILAGVQVYKEQVTVSMMGNKGIFKEQYCFNEFASYFAEEFQKLENVLLSSDARNIFQTGPAHR